MTKYIPIVDLDLHKEYFDTIAIVEIDDSRAKYDKDNNVFVFKYQNPNEFNKTVYLQVYEDQWESMGEILFSESESFDSLEQAQKNLIIHVLRMEQT